ncbi:peptide chain release factor N(5)-glutamine methyltransferase [Neptuniibacter sp. CAU 1671]|uniref:peptide chain release factor N(5)-glutamine methyltransferase n=1 Tax=Neptuniibacter sp. CAU 1671 TaxID=3032593 RepID=UPI0023DB6EE9|nr:peptide chain release factor N(5)-glutamine methyltransferase [Neptuniibacter sp. CAU 1671]MDF2181328.1 peptide chain release factor N(5)-glutamine methyltransferase [Neptuniibacter sp. CAU 1671]
MRLDQVLLRNRDLARVSDTPDVDLELLLCHLLQKPRSFLFTWPEFELSEAQLTELEKMLSRRLQGEPVAHIIGHRGFWTFELEVSPDTLIPRSDTERLVEVALELGPSGPARVADLGTGTGAIALALATERPDWQLVASDFKPEAVALAQRNCQKLGLPNVRVVKGSWFEPHQGQYDLVVSNPPYIAPDDPHLVSGDLRFEPATALVAAEQGLADIRMISTAARDYLVSGGWLLFEHGFEQAESVRDILSELGYSDVMTRQDLAGLDRVTGGRWTKNEVDHAE